MWTHTLGKHSSSFQDAASAVNVLLRLWTTARYTAHSTVAFKNSGRRVNVIQHTTAVAQQSTANALRLVGAVALGSGPDGALLPRATQHDLAALYSSGAT